MEDDVLSGMPDLSGLPDLGSEGEGEAGAVEDGLHAEVRQFFVALAKTVRTSQLYVQGNPLLHQFLEDLRRRLADFFDVTQSLTLTIHETDIRYQGKPVFKEKMGSQENLAFQLYRDGIRRLELLPGVEEEELQRFVEVLRLAKTLKDEEDDLLTLMWNSDFKHIRYDYIDVLGDEPPVPVPDLSQDAGTELPSLPQLEVPPELQSPTLREDFEPSLYFLDEADIAHLQQELRREWERRVRRDVMLAVLDQYEMGDIARRGEVVDILRQMLPRVLAEGGFGQAAFIVAELKGIAERNQHPEIEREVEDIIGELSDPLVLEQLVRLLEDGTIDPNSEALATLLNSLRPDAIILLIQMIPSVARTDAREQLMATLDRLAKMNPQIMAGLVRAEDPRVASESAKIAGRLKMADTAEAIAGLLERNEEEVRLAAIEALVELRSSMAGVPLLEALNDRSREVRVAAAKGLAALRYSPGADRLEKHIMSADLRRTDLTEQLAFFEAYARAAGSEGTRMLARLLNGRRFFWVKHSSPVRACAARALGIVGGEEAHRALTQAERDKDPMVLSAVHAARRKPQEGKSNAD